MRSVLLFLLGLGVLASLSYAAMTSTFMVCNDDVCNDMCKSKGYDSGKCSGEDCACYKSGVLLSDIEKSLGLPARPLSYHQQPFNKTKFCVDLCSLISHALEPGME